MTQWLDDYLLVNDARIHYTRTDYALPPVVLLHDFTQSGLCWKRTARDLEYKYDVVMPDMRGHGASHELPMDPAALVADTVNLIEMLQLKQPALLGHGMGAATALTIAASHPELVRCLLLEDPPWRDADQRIGSSTRAGIPQPYPSMNWIVTLKALPPPRRLERARNVHPSWSTIDITYWTEALTQFNLHPVAEHTEQPAWSDLLSRVECPILLLIGDRDLGAIVSKRTAQRASTLWHYGQLIHIPNAGHHIRYDKYSEYIEPVMSFLHRNF